MLARASLFGTLGVLRLRARRRGLGARRRGLGPRPRCLARLRQACHGAVSRAQQLEHKVL